MMMPLRSWLALAMLGLVLMGILTLLERLEMQAKAERKVNLPPVDYLFEDVRYTSLDQAGVLRLQLHAERMDHKRNERVLTLIKPKITRFGEAESPPNPSVAGAARMPLLSTGAKAPGGVSGVQTLTAARALVYEEGERVNLQGGVVIVSGTAQPLSAPVGAALATKNVAQLRTAELTLIPKERRAFTDGSVQIQQAGATLSGRGLRADFNRQTMELLNDVRSQIQPRS